MRFDAWHLMKESQRKGEKKTGWQTDTQMLKEKKNPMENKELKLLNVGGRFGLGAFFFFLLFLFHYLFLTSGFHTAFPLRRLFSSTASDWLPEP